MKLDRAELAGTGAALAFHVALIAALSMSLAHVIRPPEPPAMEVELVDEVGLQSAAPAAIAKPPPPSQAPELATIPQPAAPPEPAPVAEVRPAPAPSLAPAPTARPAAAPARAAPPRTVPTPAKTAKARPAAAPSALRIGADFLKGIPDAPASTAPAKAAASTFSAQAKIDIGQALLQQAKRCAASQPFLGDGANRVRLKVNLSFARDGRLLRPPTVLDRNGDPELVAKYGDLLEDQVQRIFVDCSPFRLPPELYDTANGGWKNFTFSYRVD